MTQADSRTKRIPASRSAVGAYEAALVELLPSQEQALLLVACLAEQPAAGAWLDYVAAVRDPKAYFEADQTGLKGLLPFVGSSLERNGIDSGKAYQTYARVALVREEL